MKIRILFPLFCLTLLSLTSACGANTVTPPEETSLSPSTAAPSVPPQLEASEIEAIVDDLTLEQQVAQMFFVRCPETDAASLLEEYNIGGYLLFRQDFKDQTKESVLQTIQSYQEAVYTPMLIGVDEEGGTVVRVSSNPNLRSEKFQSPQALYQAGGMDLILSDTQEKDKLLASLGINVNLAPVCDVSTDPDDFIFSRSFGKNAQETSDYVRLVVTQMGEDKMGMVLKHFPGYGSNSDTHTGVAVDPRPLDTFRERDFLPFQAGIDAGAQAVLVSHNIIQALDSDTPASLSPAVHEILRDELGFDGVILTDDLIMDAITTYAEGGDAAVLAVQAGNDLLISSDFLLQYNAVLTAVEKGEISQERIRESVTRIIRWKCELGLFEDESSVLGCN